MAKSIMLQGTGSGVGKSVISAALCRIFVQDGYQVAPFKAQNMALNSFVTEEGGEIGRAQAVQAQACRIKPTVDINPVLLKPTTDIGSQVILRGKPIGNFSAKLYTRYKKRITKIVDESFKRLAKEYEIVVIEGAGSPAEINLKMHDIVNMRAAFTADAPVVLVGDIDKGGVFAWFVGTLKLLDKKERHQIKGFIINKFRGDIDLLRPGINFLEKTTGIKVLGVIPYFSQIKIPEEDGIYPAPLDIHPAPKFWCGVQTKKNNKRCGVKIGVIKLPHISNHTDFDIFEKEDIDFSYVEEPKNLKDLDVVIIPGTKNTIKDLIFLRSSGFETAIKYHTQTGKFLIGICGGYQMLGKKILDPLNIESHKKEILGFGYFDFNTVFEKKKATYQVNATFLRNDSKLTGYEIHHGKTLWNRPSKPMFIIEKRGSRKVKISDGAYTRNFQIWGTHIHGLFDNHNFRSGFLNLIREKNGLPKQEISKDLDTDKEIDKLARLVRKNLDMKYLYRILNKDV